MIKSSLLPPLKPVLLVLFCFPGSVLAVRNLQFASPLQALTIWDHDPETTDPLVNSTARSRFLPKFKAGLDAEMQARKELAAQRQEQLQISATASASGSSSSSSTENDDWANRASAAELQEQIAQEKLIERAYDRAVAPLEQAEAASLALLKAKMNAKQGRSSPAYQFVGVVGRGDCEDEKPITWYARKKPANSHWSVRLLHVNRDAIIKDLFDQGKIDIFGKYKNSGQTNPETGLPVIRSEYYVRKRSWKNFWNFSPKHFLTDSSGMYWRERRLRPGLYTDGNTVYESSYRYRDGRNGMHRRSTLAQFLRSQTINDKTKQRTLERIKKDSPDIVLED